MTYFLVTSGVMLHDYWNCTSELNPRMNTNHYDVFNTALNTIREIKHIEKFMSDKLAQHFIRIFKFTL